MTNIIRSDQVLRSRARFAIGHDPLAVDLREKLRARIEILDGRTTTDAFAGGVIWGETALSANERIALNELV